MSSPLSDTELRALADALTAAETTLHEVERAPVLDPKAWELAALTNAAAATAVEEACSPDVIRTLLDRVASAERLNTSLRETLTYYAQGGDDGGGEARELLASHVSRAASPAKESAP